MQEKVNLYSDHAVILPSVSVPHCKACLFYNFVFYTLIVFYSHKHFRTTETDEFPHYLLHFTVLVQAKHSDMPSNQWDISTCWPTAS